MEQSCHASLLLLLSIILVQNVVFAQYTWPEQVFFAPPSGKHPKFKHWINNYFPTSLVHSFVNDLVTSTNNTGQVVLTGQFSFEMLPLGSLQKHLAHEDVEVFVHDGNWTSLGVITTNSEGQLQVPIKVSDKTFSGSRVYPMKFLILGDYSVIPSSVYSLQPNTDTVVFDIDGTLTTSNWQELEEIFYTFIGESYQPKLWPNAVDAVNKWYQKGYQIVYLTGRPGFLWQNTYKWLVESGFPPGAIHLSKNLEQGSGQAVQKYKTEYMKQLQSLGNVNIVAGYGNEVTDLMAYEAVGVSIDRIFIVGPNGGKDGSMKIDNYEDHIQNFLDHLPNATISAPLYP